MFGKGLQFTPFRNTIAIDVLPNSKLRIDGIVDVNLTILIAVQFRQGLKTVRRLTAVLQNRLIPEQLPAVIDNTVSVAVQDQQTVVGRYPARLLRKTVHILIEVVATHHTSGFDTINV